MILVDANVLIYAVNREAPHHRAARAWLESAIAGDQTVGLSWNVIVAFLRLTTRPALFKKPLQVSQAFDLVERWLAEPNVEIVHPGSQHVRLMRRLLQASGTAGNLTSDAHLAALAIENNAQLCSADADFQRFAGLEWIDPFS